mgnify:CR=1 FL=1
MSQGLKLELKRVEFKKELYSNPVSYEPRNIGNMVNSYNDEYVNQYYVYDKKLIFTRHYVEEEKKNSLLKEDVLVSVKYDSLWTLPHFMFDNVFEVGAVNVSPNGHEIFFSACEREDALSRHRGGYRRRRVQECQWCKAGTQDKRRNKRLPPYKARRFRD